MYLINILIYLASLGYLIAWSITDKIGHFIFFFILGLFGLLVSILLELQKLNNKK